MRPDEHKAKASRRYQNKHKKQGDVTAAEVAQARRQAAKAKVSGVGITAIRRRNGEFDQPNQPAANTTSSESDSPVSDTRRFSRRKVTTNRDRYEEVSAEDQLKEDAELGIDRETTDLVRMLEEQEAENAGDNTAFFKFKKEQEWLDDEGVHGDAEQRLYQNLIQMDMTELEEVLSRVSYRSRLQLPDSDDTVPEYPEEVKKSNNSKPIVPGFIKNARGLVMFKKPVDHPKPEVEGIMIRNDGSNHVKVDAAKKAQQKTIVSQSPMAETKGNKISSSVNTNPTLRLPSGVQHSQYEDDLDSLLNEESPPDRAGVQSTKQHMKRPTALKKIPIKSIPKTKPNRSADTDDAWLDEMLK